MRTDELIGRLAADAGPSAVHPDRDLALAAGLAVAVIVAVFALTLGSMRPDMLAAFLASPRFQLKVVVSAAFAGAALLAMRAATSPEPMRRRFVLPFLAPLMLLTVGTVVEVVVLSPSGAVAAMIGNNALACLTTVTLMGAGPLGLFLLVLRRGAPRRPALAGLFAGLASGAMAATAYATHCTDDSPLFVALWYSLAVGALGVAGAAIGARSLRW